MARPRPGEIALIGGALALDFCNTLAWRISSKPVDWLGSYDGWLEWSVHTGCLPAEQATALQAHAGRRPGEAAAAFARVDAFRARAGAVFDSLAAGAAPDSDDLDACRSMYVEALGAAHLHVEPHGAAIEWPSTIDLDRPLWPVSESVWSLLLTPGRLPIRVCGGPGCGWLFLDGTRNASRRWCSPDDCGRRERVRRHRSRRAATGRKAT